MIFLITSIIYNTCPEIDDANLKCTLWDFKQWLVLEMWVRYGVSIVLVLRSS